ncbi:MAG: LSM domain-containing protein [Candidatus Thorarchaeota archaeon]
MKKLGKYSFVATVLSFESKGFIIVAQATPDEEVLMPAENSPIKALEQRLSDIVSIKLKDDRIFRGRLTRCDQYMNLTLGDAVELENDETKAKYGSILIRGNNILWIQIPE